MIKVNSKGFSMIELLAVLLIIGILSAVAGPLFIANTAKSKVSEAVSGAGAIRSGERTYYSQNGSYFAYATGTEATGEFATGGGSNLGVTIHGNKYFSPKSYTITTFGSGSGGTGTWQTLGGGSAPSSVTSPLDFVISVTGSLSQPLSGSDTDGAGGVSAATLAGNPVYNYVVEMDNAGQVIYTTNYGASGTTWSAF